MTNAEFMLEWAASRKGSLYIPREVLEALSALARNVRCQCVDRMEGMFHLCSTCGHCEALRKFRAAMEGKEKDDS